MPSDRAKVFPSKVEARFVQHWIEAALNKKGVEVADYSKSEGFGILVPHDLLFAKEESKRKIDVAARLWRISPAALQQTLRNAGSRSNILTNPFALDKPHGSFRDLKGKYQLNSLMTEQLTDLALTAAASKAANAEKSISNYINRKNMMNHVYLRAKFRNINSILVLSIRN